MKQMTSGDAAVVAGGGELPAGAPEAGGRPLRELMDDRLLDALLERSRDQAGGLRLTGEGSMLGELIRAVLERARESELTAHLGYDRHERGGAGNARNGTAAKTVQTGVGPVPTTNSWRSPAEGANGQRSRCRPPLPPGPDPNKRVSQDKHNIQYETRDQRQKIGS